MNKILFYWKGSDYPEILSNNIKKLSRMGFEIEVGPTCGEHEFLMSKFPYYKLAIEEEKWAFASDVWRIYKLSHEDALYIDVITEFGPDFKKFYESFSQSKTFAIRGSDLAVSNGFLYSNGAQQFYSDWLDVYRTFDPGKTPSTNIWWSGPDVALFVALKKQLLIKGEFGVVEKHGHKFGIYKDTLNKRTVFSVGSGSWIEGHDHSNYNDYQNKIVEQMNNKIIRKDILMDSIFFFESNESLPSFSPQRLRRAYERSTKKSGKLLRDIYKNRSFKIKYISNRIWPVTIERIFKKID